MFYKKITKGQYDAEASFIPATAHITQHANRLKHLGAISKYGGIVLAGVGLTAACMKITNTADTKNEMFSETGWNLHK
ncbi:MAG: hypothetical protein L3J89_07525 [Gammaproteobacteria bacterium]|nr:hypothetical protein [Gammaproteobacteria bacterium]